MLKISRQTAQKLAVTRQRLAAPTAPATLNGLKSVMRDIRCLQIDPLRPGERSQYLVLFSRLGVFPMDLLDRLAYDEKFLFEYWGHAASYVLVEDFPFHLAKMQAESQAGGIWGERIRKWLEANQAFRQDVIETIREKGPVLSKDIPDTSIKTWESTGWNANRNTTMMMTFLWDQGVVTVTSRDGNKKYWDLLERFLPGETPREVLEEDELVYQAAQHSLRGLGVGTEKQIKLHFIRHRYPNLSEALERLVADEKILPVKIKGLKDQEPWYLHAEDLALLDNLKETWAPRTTLLSPFDNLICDRDRTELLWDFYFRIEIYVPKKKRQYGYYVLPILHGNRLIGRIDPKLDRKRKVLDVNAVYAEPGAPTSNRAVSSIRRAIEDLAEFVGARDIDFHGEMPEGWEDIGG